MTATSPGDLTWLLEHLVTTVDRVRQVVILAAGESTCLAVLAEADADAGLVAYEMAVLVKRVGQHLVANPRFPARNAAPR